MMAIHGHSCIVVYPIDNADICPYIQHSLVEITNQIVHFIVARRYKYHVTF